MIPESLITSTQSVTVPESLKNRMESVIKLYLPNYRVIWSDRLYTVAACTYENTNTISFSNSLMNEWYATNPFREHDYLIIVFHEIAHALHKPRPKNEKPHGREWLEIFIRLLHENNLGDYEESVRENPTLKPLHNNRNKEVIQ